MEDRSWHSSWLVPLNKSPALPCPFTSDTLVYPRAACALLFCHVLCCPHRHTQLSAQTHLSRYSYMLNHPLMYTHSHARRWTLILICQTKVLFQSATPVSSRQGMLFPHEGNIDLCSVFAQSPVYSQGRREKMVMPPAMWRERVNVDTSFLQPTHAPWSALEGCQHA